MHGTYGTWVRTKIFTEQRENKKNFFHVISSFRKDYKHLFVRVLQSPCAINYICPKKNNIEAKKLSHKS